MRDHSAYSFSKIRSSKLHQNKRYISRKHLGYIHTCGRELRKVTNCFCWAGSKKKTKKVLIISLVYKQ